MASERQVTGRHYRMLSDAENKVWDNISFTTQAEDVLFEDGATLVEKFENLLKSVDEGDLNIPASSIVYNDTSTGLDATNVQEAMEKLSNRKVLIVESFDAENGILYLTSN